LHDLRHRFEFLVVVAGQLLDLLVGRNEVDLVLLADNLACEFGLVVFLANVARFVVEEAVRVSHPRHTPEEHSTQQQISTYSRQALMLSVQRSNDFIEFNRHTLFLRRASWADLQFSIFRRICRWFDPAFGLVF
jgi:hypothetical protein